MKKIRISAFFLLTLLVLCLTACGDNSNSGTAGSSASQSGMSSTGTSAESSGTAGATGTSGTTGASNGSNASGGPGSGAANNGTSGSVQESSKGVMDGLVDDVEQGVEDLTGESTSRASDESK